MVNRRSGGCEEAEAIVCRPRVDGAAVAARRVDSSFRPFDETPASATDGPEATVGDEARCSGRGGVYRGNVCGCFPVRNRQLRDPSPQPSPARATHPLPAHLAITRVSPRHGALLRSEGRGLIGGP